MVAANQYTGATDAKAQQEIQIMYCLKDKPKTPGELCDAVGLSNKRIRYLLQGLRSARCIGKVEGSHAVKLLAVYNV